MGEVSRRLSIDEAQRRVRAAVTALDGQVVALAHAGGRVLAAEVRSRWQLPATDVSIMDGYAVRSGDVDASGDVELTKVGESAAGRPMTSAVEAGTAARISTGAVVPTGADAVVAQEDTDDLGDRVRIRCDRLIDFGPGRFVRTAGSDLDADEVLLESGTRLRAGDLALTAAAGHSRVSVHRQPDVAIVSTGDELVPIGTDPGPGQLVSTNALMLAVQIESAGSLPVQLGDVGDDVDTLRRALARGLTHDVLVTSGGISVGDHDLVYDTLESLGCAFEFRGVNVRPGKPITFGLVDDTLVFALPGNPASTFVGFELFVRPALWALQGYTGAAHRSRTVEVGGTIRGAGSRAHCVRARLENGQVVPLDTQASGDLRSISGATVLVTVPPGVAEYPKGARVEALLLEP